MSRKQTFETLSDGREFEIVCCREMGGWTAYASFRDGADALEIFRRTTTWAKLKSDARVKATDLLLAHVSQTVVRAAH